MEIDKRTVLFEFGFIHNQKPFTWLKEGSGRTTLPFDSEKALDSIRLSKYWQEYMEDNELDDTDLCLYIPENDLFVKYDGEQTKEQFVGYLRDTLIPDLKGSQHDQTAKDFETAIKFMEGE